MELMGWIKGGALGLALAILVVLGLANKDQIPESDTGLTCAANLAVLEQKRRCGFADLGKMVTVSGRVKRSKIHRDGDRSIDIYPDDEFKWVLYYEGEKNRSYIHAEFTPCERAYADVSLALDEVMERFRAGEELRVEITGRWAYDGVDHRGEWGEQLSNCLDGRGPDPSVGWVEIHPAYSVVILNPLNGDGTHAAEPN